MHGVGEMHGVGGIHDVDAGCILLMGYMMEVVGWVVLLLLVLVRP